MNDIILKPIISEKSMHMAATGTYMFEVPKNANKMTVASSVTKNFKVEVDKVRISVLKGKIKKFKGMTGKRVDKKRAFVKLKSGQKITIFEESK